MLLIAVLLRLRADDPALNSGGYIPCEVSGCLDRGAFLRRSATSDVLVAFRRFPLASTQPAVAGIKLPESFGAWRDVFRPDRVVPAAELGHEIELPVSVYVAQPL